MKALGGKNFFASGCGIVEGIVVFFRRVAFVFFLSSSLRSFALLRSTYSSASSLRSSTRRAARFFSSTTFSWSKLSKVSMAASSCAISCDIMVSRWSAMMRECEIAIAASSLQLSTPCTAVRIRFKCEEPCSTATPKCSENLATDALDIAQNAFRAATLRSGSGFVVGKSRTAGGQEPRALGYFMYWCTQLFHSKLHAWMSSPAKSKMLSNVGCETRMGSKKSSSPRGTRFSSSGQATMQESGKKVPGKYHRSWPVGRSFFLKAKRWRKSNISPSHAMRRLRKPPCDALASRSNCRSASRWQLFVADTL
mmetsp:Transcript_25160/g.66546  ORF Transcript_25160/g.66546 Transcript_25160/m.66546 type:complete len:309 (+) Transcript_25160:242-1168(+)